MSFYGSHGEAYTIGNELGKGGEGTVFEVLSHPDFVFKKYREPLAPERIDKLKLMVKWHISSLEMYAALPIDLITDSSTGKICGFVMKKLVDYMPLHHLFNPMDRKKMFPSKGYNFLVHVARNLATAFHKIHESRLIVGDVNEGNIFVNEQGLVSFIDCDSFQIKGEDGYYHCEVGVPRYTPAELLKKGTFEKVVRTVNTDSFSLAVLIFQLLFLGRHPYAGKNNGTKDIDEETAIKQNQFAYSITKQRKRLNPPKESLSMTTMPENIVNLFHQAFENTNRPIPSEWVSGLNDMFSNLETCKIFSIHQYPAHLQECPWCEFRKSSGILYFLDDSYFNANEATNDIENFIAGFKTSDLEIRRWDKTFTQLPCPTPIDKKYFRYYWYSIMAIILAVSFVGTIFILFSSLISYNYLMIGILIVALVHLYSPWRIEIKNRKIELHQMFVLLHNRLVGKINQFNIPPDATAYERTAKSLFNSIGQYKTYGNYYEQKKKELDDRLYHDQLYAYLNCFKLENNQVPELSDTKKLNLIANGIATAADITKLKRTKIKGIGEKNFQILMDWRQQLETRFIYLPDNKKLNAEYDELNRKITTMKLKLESEIRRDYQTINYLKTNITRNQYLLEEQIITLAQKEKQAEADYLEFCRVFKLM